MAKAAVWTKAQSLVLFNFLKVFFLKVGMLYNISEGYPPTPTSKGTLFSKIALRKN